ncbi:MAG: hypothetical protein A3B38_02570 [Candidatus Levybacteria bacterium RIFCSPLOWO2_01_FULL_36_13]|nr:MAG: hypothetical protein A2684_03765 [Candidatus Levybacteria bacterium RIFCSPHIGHO2_01_FULL_36_15b]OGH35162.1 MAG: hypothetical protein A3B38_02570 [Candidatus Levybacteria bacterium RIFCSPLOWO2_01_FULL_36_13]
MNKYERYFRFSRMTSRVVLSSIHRSLEIKRGQEPTSMLYSSAFLPVIERMGIRKGSDKEKIARKLVHSILQYWFMADAMLDKDSVYSKMDEEILTQNIQDALNSQLFNDINMPLEIKRRIEEMEIDARRKAYVAHSEFMAKFNPSTSPFEEVLEYRIDTTGLFGETIVDALNIVSGKKQDVATFKDEMLNASLCLQMLDDLVDYVSDYRKEDPNLFYALTSENPTERTKLKIASANQFILDTKRPYEIAQVYAPNTLLSYIRKLESMSSNLPPYMKKFILDTLATIPYVSFTPNSSIDRFNRSEMKKIIAKKTKVD